MNSRLRLGPPKQTFAQTSGNRMRPINLPCGVHTVTPLYPIARPALLEHQRLPSTSHRTPSGEHFTLSIMKSLKSFRLETLLFVPTSKEYISPLPPGPVSPGPLPVLMT